MGLKLKLSADGTSAMINDKGLPVLVDDANPSQEYPVDVVHLYQKTGEIQKRLETLDARDKALAGIETVLKNHGIEPDKIDSWIAEQKNKKPGKEPDEALKTAMAEQQKGYEKKIAELKGELENSEKTIYGMMISERFKTSKFVKEKLALPTVAAAEAYFGKHFKIEADQTGNRRIIGYYPDGSKILSISKGYEPADFEEALELLTAKDSDRDNLLRGTGASGTGAQSGAYKTGNMRNPWKKDTTNLTERAKIQRENPALAERLRAEAGR